MNTNVIRIVEISGLRDSELDAIDFEMTGHPMAAEVGRIRTDVHALDERLESGVRWRKTSAKAPIEAAYKLAIEENVEEIVFTK